MIIIDAKDLIVGRFATFAAKQALLGNEIAIVNCEKAYLTGTPTHVLSEFRRKRVQGTWATGPFYHRQPDRLVRRMIRGMLPHKQEKGKSAYQRIMCYIGVPSDFKNRRSRFSIRTHPLHPSHDTAFFRLHGEAGGGAARRTFPRGTFLAAVRGWPGLHFFQGGIRPFAGIGAPV